MQIIQFRAGHEFAGGAPDARGLAVVNEEIVSDDGLRRNIRLGRDQLLQADVPVEAIQGQQLLLDLDRPAFVDASVHMDGQTRDHQQVSCNIDKLCRDAAARSKHNTPGHGKRSVKPGCQERAAVQFDVQPGVLSFCPDLRILFDFQHRRVAVRRHDHKTAKIIPGNPERNDRGIVARDEIAAASLQMPQAALGQRNVAGFKKPAALPVNDMVNAGMLLNETQQFPTVPIHLSVSFSGTLF